MPILLLPRGSAATVHAGDEDSSMVDRCYANANVAFTWSIWVEDSNGNPITGLTAGSFTIYLIANNANSGLTVTVHETDSVNEPGRYDLTFVPNAAGAWENRVKHATYFVSPGSKSARCFVQVGGSPIDWGSMYNPGASNNLTGTTISTSQSVATVSGNVNGNVIGNVLGDVQGKVLGGGASTITGTGSRADVSSVTAGAIAAASFASGALGAVWDELTASHVAASTFGKLLGTFAFAGSNVKADVETCATGAVINGLAVRAGTAQAGAGQSITLDAGAPATDNVYTYDLVVLTGGTGSGQTNVVVGYNGTTKVASVYNTWNITPDNTTTFALMPFSKVYVNVADFSGQTAPSLVGGRLDSNVGSWRSSTPNVLISGRVDAVASVVSDKTGYSLVSNAIDAAQITAGAAQFLADGLLDRANAIAGVATVRQVLRWCSAVLLGKNSGNPSAPVFQDPAGVTAVSAAVDGNGNRTGVTLS